MTVGNQVLNIIPLIGVEPIITTSGINIIKVKVINIKPAREYAIQ